MTDESSIEDMKSGEIGDFPSDKRNTGETVKGVDAFQLCEVLRRQPKLSVGMIMGPWLISG